MVDNKNEKDWSETSYNLFEYFWANSIFSVKDEKNLPYFLKVCPNILLPAKLQNN